MQFTKEEETAYAPLFDSDDESDAGSTVGSSDESEDESGASDSDAASSDDDSDETGSDSDGSDGSASAKPSVNKDASKIYDEFDRNGDGRLSKVRRVRGPVARRMDPAGFTRP